MSTHLLPYHDGSADVTADDVIVTGTLTAFLAAVKPGDLFVAQGESVAIQSVTSNTELTLVRPWPGTTETLVGADFDYEIRRGPAWADVADVNLRVAELARIRPGGTSLSSLTVGTGTKTATVQTGLPFQPGARLRLSVTGTPSIWMDGVCTDYSGTTLDLDIDATSGHSSTHANWRINYAGATGPQGPTGVTGAAGVGVPAGGTTGQVLIKNSGTDFDTEWGDPPASSDIANVKDYGAVGDNTADDTAAIQAALDAALHVSFGGVGDHYKITDTLTLRSGHKLDLAGATVEQHSTQTITFDIQTESNIAIFGGTMIGKEETSYVNSSSSLAIAIRGVTVTGLTVERMKFQGFCYAPLYVHTNSSVIIFRQNDVVGPGATVLDDPNYRNTLGCTIIGTNVVIEGNRITDTASGLIVGQGSRGVVISNNIIHDVVTEHGMYIDTGVRDLTITGNTIRNVVHTGMKVQYYDAGVTVPEAISITGNTIETSISGDGILIVNTDPTSMKALGVSVSGNVIRNVAQDGISVRWVAGASITGNTVFTAGRIGIDIVSSDDVAVSGNMVKSTTQQGIKSGAGVGHMISGNTVVNADTYGIHVNAGSEKCVVNNVCRGNGSDMQYGLFIEAGDQTTMTVSGNHLTGASDYGARFKNPVEALRCFSGNVLQGGSGNDLALYPPVTDQRGTHERMYFSTAQPSAGTWRRGSMVLNKTPTTGTPTGWVCLVDGTPGQWAALSVASPSGVASAPFNLLKDGGRFGPSPEAQTVSVGTYADPTYFNKPNGATFAQGPKFIHDNTDYGGAAGSLDADVKALIDRIKDGSNPSYRRYGVEFHTLELTAGSGTNNPLTVGPTTYYLCLTNLAVPIPGNLTLNFHLLVKSGAIALYNDQLENYLYVDGTLASGTLVRDNSSGWAQITRLYRPRPDRFAGYNNILPRLYATPGTVMLIATPMICPGHVPISPGQWYLTVPSLEAWR